MSTTEPNYTQLYRNVAPSVVSLYVNGDATRSRSGAGSGFVYDEAGHVVTNHHVLDGPPERLDRRRRSRRHGDRRSPPRNEPEPIEEHVDLDVRFSEGDWRVGRLVGTDRYTDLAVVAVDDLPPYAESLAVAAENPEQGRPVAAFGNPMGLDGTITTGVVSGVSRTTPVGDGFAIPDVVQTDAPINPGNSGGPLVAIDDDGAPEVVGVNRAKTGENIGFAISPAVVSRVVPDLLESGRCEHATLHVSTLDVSPTVAEANGLDEPGGVLVVDVREGPASGILGGCHSLGQVRGREVPVGGDVLVGIDGRDLRSTEELTSYLLTETRPGETVTFAVRRPAGEASEVVRLAGRDRPADVGGAADGIAAR